jgi:hypothetical protein
VQHRDDLYGCCHVFSFHIGFSNGIHALTDELGQVDFADALDDAVLVVRADHPQLLDQPLVLFNACIQFLQVEIQTGLGVSRVKSCVGFLENYHGYAHGHGGHENTCVCVNNGETPLRGIFAFCSRASLILAEFGGSRHKEQSRQTRADAPLSLSLSHMHAQHWLTVFSQHSDFERAIHPSVRSKMD